MKRKATQGDENRGKRKKVSATPPKKPQAAGGLETPDNANKKKKKTQKKNKDPKTPAPKPASAKKFVSFSPQLCHVEYTFSKQEYDRTPCFEGMNPHYCNHCQELIDVGRFHCTECPDFDLCHTCFVIVASRHQHGIEAFECDDVDALYDEGDHLFDEGDEGEPWGPEEIARLEELGMLEEDLEWPGSQEYWAKKKEDEELLIPQAKAQAEADASEVADAAAPSNVITIKNKKKKKKKSNKEDTPTPSAPVVPSPIAKKKKGKNVATSPAPPVPTPPVAASKPTSQKKKKKKKKKNKAV